MYQLGLGPQYVLCNRRQRTIANEGMLTEKISQLVSQYQWSASKHMHASDIIESEQVIFTFLGEEKKPHVLTMKEKRPGLRESKEGKREEVERGNGGGKM